MNHQKTLAGVQSHRYEAIPSGPHDELPHIIENEKVLLDQSNKNRKRILTIAIVLSIASLTYFAHQDSWLLSKNPDYDYSSAIMPGKDYTRPNSPFSYLDPSKLILETDRTVDSKPGKIWGDLRFEKFPLPTNSWCMGLFLGTGNRTDEDNKVFQLPYVIESFQFMQGIRAHPIRVQANDRVVMMIYEKENGMAIGAVEPFYAHELAADKNLAIGRLSVVLQWKSPAYVQSGWRKNGPMMYTPIVRGSPYISMLYNEATPRIFVQRSINDENSIVIDNNPTGSKLICGSKLGEFSKKPVLVNSELKVTFAVSDMTWLIFVSEPTLFVCSNLPLSTEADIIEHFPGWVGKTEPGWENKLPFFDLRAVHPMKKGMVRIALGNNCSTGTHHAATCETPPGVPRDNDNFIQLLRDSADIFATGHADVDFEFPATSKEEDELQLKFDWKQNLMSKIKYLKKDEFFHSEPKANIDPTGKQLLMYAIPHHQERMMAIPESINRVLNVGCTPTLHGMACPVIGNKWSLVEHLHRVEFQASRPPRMEMIPAIREALTKEITYEIPLNYQRGAGDTYFSGKLLSKLARMLLIADEVGLPDTDVPSKFDAALDRLKEGVEIWLNGTGLSPLLYDRHWGGVVSCGCNFDFENQGCHNKYPDCPALTDMGENFGAGFYNDHHFHYGYHIYAAAVIAKFDALWGKQYFERVLMLVRDIANPSPQDPHFPTFRHKDWFLGFSWASGIVTHSGKPYPNGQNQESSSEAISAYEAVALYGKTMALVYKYSPEPLDKTRYIISRRISDMGRLLCATETRSAKTYWHVQTRGAGVPRIYPDVYSPKVVGMVWSLLAQEQTWFGNEPYKSYGIQLMPLTASSELRDDPAWVNEMLPFFLDSCNKNEGKYGCTNTGWRVLVFAMQATIGDWVNAWHNTNQLSDDVYDSAGGNGHSKANTLWYIATRPDVIPSYNFSYVYDGNSSSTNPNSEPDISVPP